MAPNSVLVKSGGEKNTRDPKPRDCEWKDCPWIPHLSSPEEAALNFRDFRQALQRKFAALKNIRADLEECGVCELPKCWKYVAADARTIFRCLGSQGDV